jgi:predicted DNA-binding transcriptional regulator AlpA
MSTTPSIPILEPPLLLSVKEAAHLVGLSSRSVWRLVSTGQFPPADVRLGSRIVKWRRETVISWINSQTGESK